MADKKLFADMGEKTKKKLDIAVIVGVIAIGLLLLLPGLDFGAGGSGTDNAASSYFNAEAEQEALRQTLSSIKGAGEVQVMITYRAAEQKQQAPAAESALSNSAALGGYGSGTANGTKDAQQRPEVLGVVVVAEGAYDISVRVSLAGAVQTALGITADRVDVYEMK